MGLGVRLGLTPSRDESQAREALLYSSAMSVPAPIDLAVSALRQGRLALLPTETVYGLAADAGDPAAVAAIYTAKGRPAFNPLIAHVVDLATACEIAELDDRALALADAFWPGPLTIVARVRRTDLVCDLARAGLDTVAIRVPAHPLFQEVLKAFGGAVAAPSANRSGRPSPTSLADAMEETGAFADAALDGGPCDVGVESTVIGLVDEAELLRAGGLARDRIEAVIGRVRDLGVDLHRTPGRLVAHYAPDAPVRINAAAPREGEAFLSFGTGPETSPMRFSLSETGDVNEAAQRLFRLLRAADRLNPAAIAVAPVPMEGLGEAVNDRLARAAGKVG
jgi:L-threonylcarbamoyladenylate synthase